MYYTILWVYLAEMPKELQNKKKSLIVIIRQVTNTYRV
jgi:hypothetical protein